MVVFEGQTGSVAGHSGICHSASDSGARFAFDEYGEVSFDSSGRGENAKVVVQLEKEYGRFFCSVATCGGFKHWISSLGILTVKIVAGRVTVILFDCIMKQPLANARVCLGLMCKNTEANGEVYLGQFALGDYPLVIAMNGYENLVETLTVDRAEIRTSRCLTPTGETLPGVGCDGFPAFLRGICHRIDSVVDERIAALKKAVSNIIRESIAALEARLTAALSGLGYRLEERIAGAVSGLLARLNEAVAGLSQYIDEIDARIDDRMDKLKAVLKERILQAIADMTAMLEKAIAGVMKYTDALEERVNARFDALESWLEERIVAVLLRALDREVAKEGK